MDFWGIFELSKGGRAFRQARRNGAGVGHISQTGELTTRGRLIVAWIDPWGGGGDARSTSELMQICKGVHDVSIDRLGVSELQTSWQQVNMLTVRGINDSRQESDAWEGRAARAKEIYLNVRVQNVDNGEVVFSLHTIMCHRIKISYHTNTPRKRSSLPSKAYSPEPVPGPMIECKGVRFVLGTYWGNRGPILELYYGLIGSPSRPRRAPAPHRRQLIRQARAT